MEQRTLGRTGAKVSVVGLGTWQIGADWGDVAEPVALEMLDKAQRDGVTLFDTADVYGDGRSERLIAEYLRHVPAHRHPFVATKMGRRLPQLVGNYTWSNFVEWTDRSRTNLRMDTLDLVQLHCPPSGVYGNEEVYENLDRLVEEGRIKNYGVSVETCDEALEALEHDGVATIQIILNVFRRKPLDEVLPLAQSKGVGIIARVPLASGLLSGRFSHDTEFAKDDHRNFNRNGEAFDQGETFSGVDYDDGVHAAREFTELARELGPKNSTPAQVALRWVIDQPGVTTVIPGARSAEQARGNAAAGKLPPLSQELNAALEELYDRHFRDAIHEKW
ncbi:MAG TPA: aldo/keto reductase [Actinomycetales bacterium]|nr:aldo/keto reductase [Actinomycetales bacterium]